MKTLSATDIKDILKQGCGASHCGHVHSELVLAGRCHTAQGTVAHVLNGVLEVACKVCGRDIAKVFVGTTVPHINLMPTCHDDGVEVWVDVNGKATVKCRTCEWVQAILPIAEPA